MGYFFLLFFSSIWTDSSITTYSRHPLFHLQLFWQQVIICFSLLFAVIYFLQTHQHNIHFKICSKFWHVYLVFLINFKYMNKILKILPSKSPYDFFFFFSKKNVCRNSDDSTNMNWVYLSFFKKPDKKQDIPSYWSSHHNSDISD